MVLDELEEGSRVLRDLDLLALVDALVLERIEPAPPSLSRDLGRSKTLTWPFLLFVMMGVGRVLDLDLGLGVAGGTNGTLPRVARAQVRWKST